MLLFISVIPTAYSVTVNPITKDNHINSGFTYWGKSDWGKGLTTWTWEDNTYMDMTVWAYDP